MRDMHRSYVSKSFTKRSTYVVATYLLVIAFDGSKNRSHKCHSTRRTIWNANFAFKACCRYMALRKTAYVKNINQHLKIKYMVLSPDLSTSIDKN